MQTYMFSIYFKEAKFVCASLPCWKFALKPTAILLLEVGTICNGSEKWTNLPKEKVSPNEVALLLQNKASQRKLWIRTESFSFVAGHFSPRAKYFVKEHHFVSGRRKRYCNHKRRPTPKTTHGFAVKKMIFLKLISKPWGSTLGGVSLQFMWLTFRKKLKVSEISYSFL